MRDMGTFIAPPGTPRIPAGNHFGYIDYETDFAIDLTIPFPHMRATVRPARYVARIERSVHPQWFGPANPYCYCDVDVSDLAAKRQITFDQYQRPDVAV